MVDSSSRRQTQMIKQLQQRLKPGPIKSAQSAKWQRRRRRIRARFFINYDLDDDSANRGLTDSQKRRLFVTPREINSSLVCSSRSRGILICSVWSNGRDKRTFLPYPGAYLRKKPVYCSEECY